MTHEAQEVDYEYKCPRCLKSVSRIGFEQECFFCSPTCARQFVRENGPVAMDHLKRALCEARFIDEPVCLGTQEYWELADQARAMHRKLRGRQKYSPVAGVAIAVAQETTERIHAIKNLGRQAFYRMQHKDGRLAYFYEHRRALPRPPGAEYSTLGQKTLVSTLRRGEGVNNA